MISRISDSFSSTLLLIILNLCIVPSVFGKYSGGEGTSASPWLIATADDMQALGANVADWNGYYFRMTADIDMSKYSGSTYNMIGGFANGDLQPFNGVFDGAGHTIRNFNYVAKPGDTRVGLFGLVSWYVINVNMVNASVDCGNTEYSSIESSGILAGEMVRGVIANCHVAGYIRGGYTFNVGGLVGRVNGRYETMLYNCSATVNLEMPERADGFDIGGLVGWLEGTVSHCRSSGLISAIGYAAMIRSLGGLVGYCENATISDSYSTARCVSIYKHFGDPDYVQDAFGRVGGLLGYTWYGTTLLRHCYAAGSVSGTAPFMGGLIGWTPGSEVTVTGSFWDKDTTGQNTSAGGGTGLSTAAMQTKATFINAGWDFVDETQNGTADIWAIAPNIYPVFSDERIKLVSKEARYYSVPGRAAEDYVVRHFDEPNLPDITLHGTTVAVVSLKLIGGNSANQSFTLTSDAKNAVTQAGYGQFDMPAVITTDSNGEARFNVRTANLYEMDRGDVPHLQVVDITATGGTGSNLTVKIELPVVNNFEKLTKMYERDIPLGLVIRNFNQLSLAQQVLVSTGIYAGAVNNAKSYSDSAYSVYTCGGYQTQVLYWLDTMRFSTDLQWILNGFDYGPVKQLGGAHQAASLWAGDKGPYDWDYARILDPWPAQNPKNSMYTWTGWLSTIGLALPFGGIVLEVCTAPGSSDDNINTHYPNTGNAYPAEPYWSFHSNTPPQLGVLVDCPVDALLTDGQGRRVGYLSGTPDDQNPFISEIPGVRQYPMMLADGTRAWYLDLPDSVTTLELTGNGTGPVALYWMKGEQTAAFSSRIWPGRVATMTLDTGSNVPPVMLLSDGVTVLPDGMLSLGDWNYDPRLHTSASALTIHNTSSIPLYPPLRMVLEDAEPNTISLAAPDGISADGFEYCNLFLPPGVTQIDPNATVACDVAFLNPQHQWFDLKLRLKAQIQPGGTATTGLAVTHTGISSLDDLLILAVQWLETSCTSPDWCEGADRDQNGRVNLDDFELLASNWLDKAN